MNEADIERIVCKFLDTLDHFQKTSDDRQKQNYIDERDLYNLVISLTKEVANGKSIQ